MVDINFTSKIYLFLLISLAAANYAASQLCQQSLPLQYDPVADPSTATSNLGSFYLYPSAFNDTRCVGTLSSLQYHFCYLNSGSTGRPPVVFTVLILRDDGDDYTVLDSYSEREDRDCDLMGNTCCKMMDISSQFQVRTDLAVGFVVPNDPNGNFLYGTQSVSQGIQTTIDAANTAVNSRIEKQNLPKEQMINNRRFSVMFSTDSPSPSITSGVTENSSVTMETEENNVGGRNTNGGAVAAGVIVALLVVVAAIAIAAVLAVLFVWRQRKQKDAKITSVNTAGAFENQEYKTETGTINGKSVMLTDLVEADYSVPHDYATVSPEKAEEYYEEMNASAYLSPIDSGVSVKNNTVTANGNQMAQLMNSVGAMSLRSKGDTSPLPPVAGRINPYADTLRSMDIVSVGRSDTIKESGEEPIYQDPAEDEVALYEQYKCMNINYIPNNHISTADVLGSGQFGVVYRGQWMVQGEEESIDVAVKTLKQNSQEVDKVKFLQEAAIIGQFSHPNVVKLHGLVLGDRKMIVLELLQGGDLYHTLIDLNQKSSGGKNVDRDLPHTLLSYCRQVASGMGYLASKSFVHRDLAARNILLSEDDVCKITDFGMSRDLANTNYYMSRGGKIPVRWTAPEAIHFHTYSTASDVWSFGCVMYEIWSLGHKPFESYSNADCIQLVDEGIRLPPPPGCPKTIYTLMIDCWHPDSSSRPDFVSVVQQLSLPDTKLLKWSEEDKATDTEAAILGAGLEKGVDLYKDLQERYTTS